MDDYAKVLQCLRYFDQTLGARLTGFELLWNNTYQTMTAEDTHYNRLCKKRKCMSSLSNCLANMHSATLKTYKTLVRMGLNKMDC